MSGTSDGDQRWRGTSPEERADDRRERLMKACLDLVGQDGAAGLGVRAVCRLANVSHRYFYESFPDADALLICTYEHAVTQLLDEVSSAIAGLSTNKSDLETQLRVSFAAATSFLERDPPSGRLIFREALASDVLRHRARPMLPAFLQAVQARTGADSAMPPAYRQLQTVLMSGGLAALFIEWLSGTASFTAAELVEYCTQSMVAILAVDPASTRS